MSFFKVPYAARASTALLLQKFATLNLVHSVWYNQFASGGIMGKGREEKGREMADQGLKGKLEGFKVEG